MSFKKIFFSCLLLFCVIVEVNSQNNTCNAAIPFCTTAGIDFPNIIGSPSTQEIGCLVSTPNQSWLFLKIEDSGDLFMLIEQNTKADFTGDPIDVDFISWGPFTETEFNDGICGKLTDDRRVPGETGANGTPILTESSGCSFSQETTEHFNIIGAKAGEYYMLMTTNFAFTSEIGTPGFIKVTINSGAGSTDCAILESTLGADQDVCEGDPVTLDATPLQGVAVSYVWSLDTGSGFSVLPGESNATLSPAVSGTYRVVVTDDLNQEVTDEVIITFHDIPDITQPNNIKACDDTTNDGVASFNFNILQDSDILNGEDPTLFNVTYHENLADAQANNAPLSVPYTSEAGSYPKTIFARIENNNNTSCFETTSFTVEVFDSPNPREAATIEMISECDNTSSGTGSDGFIVFNLEDREAEILNGQSNADFSLTYFTDSGYTNQIGSPSTFTNTVAYGQTIYVRMSNNLNTNCYADTSFEIEVRAWPDVNPIVQLVQCDDDNDGYSVFNLTEADNLILNNPSNETITYYLTQAEADSGIASAQIPNITNFPNQNPSNGIVFARIDNQDDCYRTAQIDLLVGATQIPSAFNLTYNECDNTLIDDDSTNGIAAFDFSDADAQIQALFPGGIYISYFTNLQDALEESNAIADISNHRNDASPFSQVIYVRIDSEVNNACLGLGAHITLIVDPLPQTNVISNLEACSDTNQATFDLTPKDTEVIGGQTQTILISYHRSLNDAETNNAAIVGDFANTSNPQTIYVRAQFDENGNGMGDPGECVNTDMTFDLLVNPNPGLIIPEPISICSNQTTAIYDLTVKTEQITGGDTAIFLNYFETQSDLDINNSIADPTQFTSTLLNNSVLVQGIDANGCSTIISLALETILYENLNLNPSQIEACEVDNDGMDIFNLTIRESEILNGLPASDFIFVYYETEADAISGSSNYISNPESFFNTKSESQTVYVRVETVTNECYLIASLPLLVKSVAPIAINDEYVICLAPDATIIAPGQDMLLPLPPIDTQLSENDFTFQWYEGEEVNPQDMIVDETRSSFTPTSEGYYTVAVTDVISGCTIHATTLVIGSYPPESISLNVVTDAFSSNNILEVNVVGNGIYEYSLNDGPWQSSTRFENVPGGIHYVRVRDIYNCNDLISELVLVMDYPKFFSPNGDGRNDTWQIFGINRQYDAEIYIHDRYGKLLKQLSPTGNGWDGTFNGTPLPSDDYWFTVEFKEPKDNNIRRQFRAHFSLRR